MGEGGDDGLDHLKSKKRCAAALARLSWNIGLAEALVNAGALKAIMVLLGVDCAVTQANCAIVICNLAHNPNVAKNMIENDVTAALGLLSLSDSNLQTKYNTAVALCLLSSVDGLEHKITSGGGIPSVMALRTSNPVTELVCALTLLNLSCVGKAAAKLVDSELIPSLLSFITALSVNAGGHGSDPRIVCFRALLNISTRRSSRGQLLSEGIIPLIVSSASKEVL